MTISEAQKPSPTNAPEFNLKVDRRTFLQWSLFLGTASVIGGCGSGAVENATPAIPGATPKATEAPSPTATPPPAPTESPTAAATPTPTDTVTATATKKPEGPATYVVVADRMFASIGIANSPPMVEINNGGKGITLRGPSKGFLVIASEPALGTILPGDDFAIIFTLKRGQSTGTGTIDTIQLLDQRPAESQASALIIQASPSGKLSFYENTTRSSGGLKGLGDAKAPESGDITLWFTNVRDDKQRRLTVLNTQDQRVILSASLPYKLFGDNNNPLSFRFQIGDGSESFSLQGLSVSVPPISK